MASDISAGKRQRIASALSTALIPFTHARSESINTDSLNSKFLQLGRRSGGRPQRAVHPMRLPVNIVIHTTLVGLEPATFRSLVDCWSNALPVVPPTHDSHFRRHRICDFVYCDRCYRSVVCLSVCLSPFVQCAQAAEVSRHDFFLLRQPHVSPRWPWNLAYIGRPLPLQILPKSDPPPIDLSVGYIRRQITAEWLEVAQWSQWWV